MINPARQERQIRSNLPHSRTTEFPAKNIQSYSIQEKCAIPKLAALLQDWIELRRLPSYSQT